MKRASNSLADLQAGKPRYKRKRGKPLRHAVCAREGCDTEFDTPWDNKLYCSIECNEAVQTMRNNARLKRLRAAKKEGQ